MSLIQSREEFEELLRRGPAMRAPANRHEIRDDSDEGW